jgi:rRNA-processing protein FCF1
VDRYNDFIYDKSNLVPEHLLEYTNNYEHVGEYYIVKKYLKIFKDENDFPATIKAMYKINNELRQLTHRDFYTCINWTIKDEIKDIKKLNKTKNDIDKIIKDYKEYYEKYKKYIIEQKKVLEKTKKTNPILEQKEYDEQIEKVSKSS